MSLDEAIEAVRVTERESRRAAALSEAARLAGRDAADAEYTAREAASEAWNALGRLIGESV